MLNAKDAKRKPSDEAGEPSASLPCLPWRPWRFSLLLLAAAFALLPFGCQSTPPAAGVQALPPPTADEYAVIRRDYNAWADSVKQFWSRADVEAEWYDDKDHHHVEHGGGQLILRKPLDTALTIGKLGNLLYWLGSNAQQFWVFDLQDNADHPSTLYIGQQQDAAKLGPADVAGLPLPLRPSEVIGLLGVDPLPAMTPRTTLRRESAGGRTLIVVTFPLPGGSDAVATLRRVWIDAATHRPAGVTFLRDSQVLAKSSLGGYEPVTTPSLAPDAYPRVPTRIEVALPRRRASLRLFLSGLTTAKVADDQFNLATLKDRLAPRRVHVLAPEPADTAP